MVQGYMGWGGQSALLSTPGVPSPDPARQVGASPPRRPQPPPDPQARTLRHRPRFCQGHISGLGMERPGYGGRGRRLHGPPLLLRRRRRGPVASADLPRADDANRRPGRDHWRATGGIGGSGWALGTVRRAGSGPGAPPTSGPRALGGGQQGASTALRSPQSGLRPSEERPLSITVLKNQARAIFCPWKSWERGGNRCLGRARPSLCA